MSAAEKIADRVGAHVAAVFVFPNGMVGVTDHNGQQIPFLQGRKEEALPLVRRAVRGREGEIEWKGWRPDDA